MLLSAPPDALVEPFTSNMMVFPLISEVIVASYAGQDDEMPVIWTGDATESPISFI